MMLGEESKVIERGVWTSTCFLIHLTGDIALRLAPLARPGRSPIRERPAQLLRSVASRLSSARMYLSADRVKR